MAPKRERRKDVSRNMGAFGLGGLPTGPPGGEADGPETQNTSPKAEEAGAPPRRFSSKEEEKQAKEEEKKEKGR